MVQYNYVKEQRSIPTVKGQFSGGSSMILQVISAVLGWLQFAVILLNLN
jgi:hypothetical protein